MNISIEINICLYINCVLDFCTNVIKKQNEKINFFPHL